MRRPRPVLLHVLALLLAPALLLGCSDDGDDGGDDTTTTAEAGADDEASTDDDSDGAEEEPSGELVDTPFCQSLLAIDRIESDGDSADDVLAGADHVGSLIDAAAAATPDDAPAGVGQFLGDTKAFVDAVVAADGDVTAAMTDLETSNPELLARINQEGAYQDAADYVFDSCGIDIGGAEGASGTEG